MRDDRRAVLAANVEDQPVARDGEVQRDRGRRRAPTGAKTFSSIRSKIATARSCSTSGPERPIDSSSSVDRDDAVVLASSALRGGLLIAG